jgi:hypothetical protein
MELCNHWNEVNPIYFYQTAENISCYHCLVMGNDTRENREITPKMNIYRLSKNRGCGRHLLTKAYPRKAPFYPICTCGAMEKTPSPREPPFVHFFLDYICNPHCF